MGACAAYGTRRRPRSCPVSSCVEMAARIVRSTNATPAIGGTQRSTPFCVTNRNALTISKPRRRTCTSFKHKYTPRRARSHIAYCVSMSRVWRTALVFHVYKKSTSASAASARFASSPRTRFLIKTVFSIKSATEPRSTQHLQEHIIAARRRRLSKHEEWQAPLFCCCCCCCAKICHKELKRTRMYSRLDCCALRAQEDQARARSATGAAAKKRRCLLVFVAELFTFGWLAFLFDSAPFTCVRLFVAPEPEPAQERHSLAPDRP